MKRNQSILTALLLCLLTLGQLGCASECKQLRGEYEKALTAEQPYAERGGEELPIHFGITLRDEVLNEVTERALQAKIAEALDFADEISVASGKTIGLEADGDVADLELYADGSCDHCVRVEGRLDGTVRVKLPVLPAQEVPLGGTMSLVAPLKFARGGDGGGVVQLDLAEAAEANESRIDANIRQLPPTWSKVLESPLSKLALKAIGEELEPIPVFRFRGPDLGVDGLEVLPAKLVTDAKRRTIFAGFSTNLAADVPGGIEPSTQLAAAEDIGLAVHPAVVAPAVVAMMRGEKLPRRYDSKGKADRTGPAHVLVRRFDVAGDPESDPAFDLGFRIFHLPDSGKCYRADLRASGTVAVEDGAARVSVKDVEIVDSSLSGVLEAIANWATAKFVVAGTKTLERSLSKRAFEFPGGELKLSDSELQVTPSGVWLRASAAVR